ncbi:hypothetical protein WJX73_000475 [Symbiochloris irregularis]|uniref:Importin N-terminal domain-containing protein n=1 Tax=Symbiochloris irregularis TaxID=706552 RepID=A0AAW1NX54_9CHLO
MGTAVESKTLLDMSKPIDVPLLDNTVQAFYGAGSAEERTAAERVLSELQKNPEAWTRVDAILEKSHSQQAKFFALSILEEVIKYRWGALPDEQREGIKNYISNLIIKLSTDESVFRNQKTFLNKLNIILVQVLKQEWPNKWPSFIPDLVGASKTSETLCENSMIILKLLSEEVFDFSAGHLTQAKTSELKQSLNKEFRLIHELCLFVLNASQKADLVRATLATLAAYLTWVPLGYVLESNIVELLLKLFPPAPTRNLALQCLTEVAGLTVAAEYNPHFQRLFTIFMSQLQGVLAPAVNIPLAYENGSDEEQAFIQNLALFFTAFFRAHMTSLEQGDQDRAALLAGLEYLLNISFVGDDEVLKICLDFWSFFVLNVFDSVSPNTAPGTSPRPPGGMPALSQPFLFGSGMAAAQQGRRALYSAVLSRLRLLMISRMAKPEEVIVVEDENGQIVRETMKDTDVLARYKTMHEILVYLSHLDHDDTENQMLEKLRLQLNGKEWSWGALNTLSWAIGSISGSMVEEQENRFLVTVIRDLLNLCEVTRGKDNKAVIASDIMYVVGQYPRFLRNHWKFLKTVVNKLFEFMHETHPGVQDMACETFLKITHKCKKKFVSKQVGEQDPFIVELLNNLTLTIQDLEVHQIHIFYETVGLMISADTDGHRDQYLERLMAPPNSTWRELLGQAATSPEVLQQPDAVRNMQNILATNVSVCSSLGHPFLHQLQHIYMDMLQLYGLYSQAISDSIANGGPHAAKSSGVKLMRTVKKQALRLIESFVAKCEDPDLVAQKFVPAMMDPILGDYARNVPDARDAEVLSLFAAIINELSSKMEAEVPRIFEAVFECTLQMITRNFEDYPEHRLHFFSLLRAITNNCFSTLFAMSPDQLRLVINSIIWAFRHTERNIADTGLNLLLEMLVMFERSKYATQFHQTYYMTLIQEIFAVMTDTMHKPGFKLQARILHHLFGLVSSEAIQAPLWDVQNTPGGMGAYPNNHAYVQTELAKLLQTSFPNLRPQQIEVSVRGMIELRDATAFKNHLRDLLVQTKAFASEADADLFASDAARTAEQARLAAIPGMVQPARGGEEVMGE